MTPKRILAVCGVGLLLLLFGLAWRMGGEDYSDGEAAVANVSRLRKGMDLYAVLQTLHPGRMARTNTVSYGMRPATSGVYETYHSLTPDRYLRITLAQGLLPARSASTGSKPPGITSWELKTGRSPREDMTIGRVFQVGPFHLRY